MHRIAALTIKERDISLDPGQVFQERVGLAVHATFRERVVPAMKAVESISRCRYEALPLGSFFRGQRVCYPRSPRSTCPRWEPNSAEVFERLRLREHGVLTSWEHLAFLLALQASGPPGLLIAPDNRSTLCFMRGVTEEVFLIRVFWNQGMKSWFLRAWSFKERRDRGWSTLNHLLLPAGAVMIT